MFHFFNKPPSFDFLRFHKNGFIMSFALAALTVWALFTQGLNLGIDFTGGLVMEMRTVEKADVQAMRDAMAKAGYNEVTLQNFGSDKDVMLRMQLPEGSEQATEVQKIRDAIDTAKNIEFRRVDFVGPQVGSELIKNGALAVIFSFAAIMVYIWLRFEWQYGVGAVLALIHDGFITTGFYIASGLEFNLTSIAAILTIVGYSVNDTVVIYDRVRENLRKYKKKPLTEIINMSVNDTLSRTILTAGTVLLAVSALVFAGGEVIRGFSLVMLFGVFIGSYSSIYISAPVLIYTSLRARNDDNT